MNILYRKLNKKELEENEKVLEKIEGIIEKINEDNTDCYNGVLSGLFSIRNYLNLYNISYPYYAIKGKEEERFDNIKAFLLKLEKIIFNTTVDENLENEKDKSKCINIIRDLFSLHYFPKTEQTLLEENEKNKRKREFLDKNKL